MVSIFISSVPRVRDLPGRAELMAKFMAASRRRACTPACTMPCGLHAAVVGRPPDGTDELHPAVPQPAVHVLDPTVHGQTVAPGWDSPGARSVRPRCGCVRVLPVVCGHGDHRGRPAGPRPAGPNDRARPAGTFRRTAEGE